MPDTFFFLKKPKDIVGSRESTREWARIKLFYSHGNHGSYASIVTGTSRKELVSSADETDFIISRTA